MTKEYTKEEIQIVADRLFETIANMEIDFNAWRHRNENKPGSKEIMEKMQFRINRINDAYLILNFALSKQSK